MHTESEIRKAIRPLLDKYGQLNTTQIKEKLDEVLIFDVDDLVRSTTRNEPLIMQRIGNIVAHQSDLVRVYEEGFEVDKRARPAVFTAVTGVGAQKRILSDAEVGERRKRATSFIARKQDWGKKRERDEAVGNMGEEFVYEYERERVAKIDPGLVSQVLHLSRHQGDGLGYDIASVNDDGSIRRIEVKTTTAGEDKEFFMSRNEKRFFEEYENDGAYIYRVYEFDTRTRRGKLAIIPAGVLLKDYSFDPVTFAVTKK